MATDHEPLNIPESDNAMLDKLALGLEGEREVMSPRDFYRQYRGVINSCEQALKKAYRALDDFQPGSKTNLDSNQIDFLIKWFTAFPDQLQDEIFAALKIQNNLILDTEQEAVAYISKLDKQPQIAAQSILSEYQSRFAEMESKLHTAGPIHKQ